MLRGNGNRASGARTERNECEWSCKRGPGLQCAVPIKPAHQALGKVTPILSLPSCLNTGCLIAASPSFQPFERINSQLGVRRNFVERLGFFRLGGLQAL